MPTLKEFDEQRKANRAGGGAAAAEAGDPRDSLMPSGESTIGGLLGLLAPAAAIPGAAIGASIARLRKDVPNLVEMVRHGGGLFGPMSSEGVGGAMGGAALDIGADVAKNAALNAIPGVVGKGLSLAGRGIKAGGAAAGSVPIMTRALAGPALHYMGAGEGPAIAAELASTVGPKIAEKAGPMMERAGESLPSTVLSGLRNMKMKFGTQPEHDVPATWDPAGPSRRAAAQARQDAAAAKGSGVNFGGDQVEIGNRGGFVDEPVFGRAPEPDSSAPGASGFSLDDLAGMRDMESAGFQPGAVKKITGSNSGEMARFTRNAQNQRDVKTPQDFGAAAEQNVRTNPQTGESFVGDSPASMGNPNAALSGIKSVFQRMQDEGAFGGDRTTGQFEEGPGGLTSVANQPSGRPDRSSGGIMADMEENYGHGLRAEPPFSFEGEAAGRPGEGVLPSQTIGEMGGPMDMADVPVSKNRLSTSQAEFHKKFLRDLVASMSR